MTGNAQEALPTLPFTRHTMLLRTTSLRTSFALAVALVSLLHRNAAAQPVPQLGARASAVTVAVIAIADSALAAITRGDVVALTDLMVPEAVMFPTVIRNGVTTYRVRTREAQRNAPLTGIVERGFAPQALVSGGVAMVWMPYDLYANGSWSHCGADVFTFVKSNGVWRIASLAWSAEQPPVCEKHPAGPPAPSAPPRNVLDIGVHGAMTQQLAPSTGSKSLLMFGSQTLTHRR